MSMVIKRGLIVIIVFVLLIIGFRAIQIITAEKNPIDVFKSIVKIEFDGRDVVKLDEYSYLTKSNPKYIKSFLENNGWKFQEQLGAGYSFRNANGKRLLLISKHIFGKRYLIFEEGS
ncbi:hypothetical protein [Clostridium sp. BJN0013]|uniref:hypothetical protein n=1 Tax=Clostridium sp. BJN0013 TaxID=3236840 RepID=UPI0034C69A73